MKMKENKYYPKRGSRRITRTIQTIGKRTLINMRTYIEANWADLLTKEELTNELKLDEPFLKDSSVVAKVNAMVRLKKQCDGDWNLVQKHLEVKG